MRRILARTNMGQKEATLIKCKNNSAITVATNPFFHATVKHIHVRFPFLFKLLANGDIELFNFITKEKATDINTPPLILETAIF